MYPIQCMAGFAMPIKVGRFRVTGLIAAVNDPTENSQIAIVDDSTLNENSTLGRVLTDTQLSEAQVVLANVKGLANVDSVLVVDIPEVFTRHGISVAAKNLKGGSVCLFWR